MISIIFLLPLYILGIQYQRGGFWRLLLPVTLIAFIVDIMLNYSELALLTWDYPKAGEYTFTNRLNRLIKETGLRGTLAINIAKVLNYFSPDGQHIVFIQEQI